MWISLLFLLVGCGKQHEKEDMFLYDLRVGHIKEALDIPAEAIDFSWKNADERQGAKQTAYRICVFDSENGKSEDCLWDSGKVVSDQSVYVPYGADKLDAMKDYWWQVTVWDENEKSNTSSIERFRTAPDDAAWEQSEWISAPETIKDDTLYQEETFLAQFDLKMDASQGGFIFQAEEGEYGYYKYCEFDCANEFVAISIKEVRNKECRRTQTLQTEYPSEKLHNEWTSVKIKVSEQEVNVTIGEESVQFVTENASEDMLGGFGFYHGRSRENVYVDNFVVQDAQGDQLVKEDFSEKDTVFGHKKTQVKDGVLTLRHQYVLMNTGEFPAPLFGRQFEVKEQMEKAYLHMASMGIYEATINGEKAGNCYFASGRQAYESRILYDTYDVTELLQTGLNEIDVMVGHGYFDRGGSHRSHPLGLRGILVIEYEDHTKQIIGTDAGWSFFADGPIREDDMYNGEIYDAGKEFPVSESVVSNAVQTAVTLKSELVTLPMEPYLMEQMQVIEELQPVAVTEPEKGVYVYDFGQEFTGVVRLEGLNVADEQWITLQFGEILNDEKTKEPDGAIGSVWQDNLMLAQNTYYYIGDGREDGVYENRFSCTCFRYLQITGLEEALPLEQITGKKISTNMENTGSFKTSNEKLNTLYENIVRSQNNNFLDMPSDCPQRDERYGWTGDAQVFARSASYHQDTYYFYDNFLNNMKEGQREDGAYPDMVLYEAGFGENGWGDAGITITWYHYLQYGDKRIIEKQFDSMCSYADYLVSTSEDFIRSTGGWYADHNCVATTPEAFTSTAQSAYSCKLLSQMAEVIGEQEASEKYRNYYEDYKKAFQDQFIGEDGTIECWTQTAYTLARAYGLAGEWEDEMGEYLANCITYADYHLNTGYIGTPFLLPELVNAGYADLAYKILLQETYPSWLYLVNQGATTIYERWPIYEDQEIEDYRMSQSFAHVALGSVSEFFYRYILGIEVDENVPGYKHFILQPTVEAGIDWAEGSYESVYGKIESKFEKKEDGILYSFTIPANTSATVKLPGMEPQEYESGNYEVFVQGS